MRGERWRPAPGFEEEYAVSSMGRVMRVGVGPGATLGRILRPTVTEKGYLRVELRARGQRAARYVQRLVLGAFRGEEPDALARHLDGDPQNNCLENLAWGTPRQNYRDAYVRHGTLGRDDGGRFVGADLDGW